MAKDQRVWDFVAFGDGHWAQFHDVWVVEDKLGTKFYRFRLQVTEALYKKFNIQQEEMDDEYCITRDYPIVDSVLLERGYIDQTFQELFKKLQEMQYKLKIIGGDEDLKKLYELITIIIKKKSPLVGATKITDDPQAEVKYFIFSDLNGYPTNASLLTIERNETIKLLDHENKILKSRIALLEEEIYNARVDVKEHLKKSKEEFDATGIKSIYPEYMPEEGAELVED